MRKGWFRAIVLCALALPAGSPQAAPVPARASARQVLSGSITSDSLEFQGSIFCERRSGTYRGTTLGAAVRDAQGRWIAATMLLAQGGVEDSLTVSDQRVGTRTVRTIGSGFVGYSYRVQWLPTMTRDLDAPYRLYFAVGSFGQTVDRCRMAINNVPATVVRTGRGGYIDLGAADGNAATFNRGPDESIRVEGWVPSELRTVTLSGRRVFGSAFVVPVNRVVAWRPGPTGVEAPYTVLDGLGFGADGATRIDLVSAGASITGRGLVPPAFVWFDLA